MNTKEHTLAIIKAGISTVPYIGGPIASLISDYVSFSTQKSIEEMITHLSKRLGELGDRISTETVNKDQFSELFKSCYLVIVRTNQRSKLWAAAELIANILLTEGDKEKLSYNELDHYVRCLDNLSIGAIEVLGNALKIAQNDRASNLEKDSYIFNFERLRGETVDSSPSLLMGLVGELNGVGLLRFHKIPTIMTENYSNHPLELTPLGSNFVKYILKPTSSEA